MKDGTAISLYNAFVVTNIVPKLNITWNKIGLFKQFIFKGAHQNCSVSVNVLFYLTIIVLLKTLVDVYLCSYGVLRFHVCFWTINPTYFQCKYEGKYELIVNIVNWTFPAQTPKILNVRANTLTSVDIKYDFTNMNSAHAIVVFSMKEVWPLDFPLFYIGTCNIYIYI